MKLMDKSKALEDGQMCVKLKPDWAKGYTRLAGAQHLLNRYADAMNTCQKGLDIDPCNEALIAGSNRLNGLSFPKNGYLRKRKGEIEKILAEITSRGHRHVTSFTSEQGIDFTVHAHECHDRGILAQFPDGQVLQMFRIKELDEDGKHVWSIILPSAGDLVNLVTGLSGVHYVDTSTSDGFVGPENVGLTARESKRAQDSQIALLRAVFDHSLGFLKTYDSTAGYNHLGVEGLSFAVLFHVRYQCVDLLADHRYGPVLADMITHLFDEVANHEQLRASAGVLNLQYDLCEQLEAAWMLTNKEYVISSTGQLPKHKAPWLSLSRIERLYRQVAHHATGVDNNTLYLFDEGHQKFHFYMAHGLVLKRMVQFPAKGVALDAAKYLKYAHDAYFKAYLHNKEERSGKSFFNACNAGAIIANFEKLHHLSISVTGTEFEVSPFVHGPHGHIGRPEDCLDDWANMPWHFEGILLHIRLCSICAKNSFSLSFLKQLESLDCKWRKMERLDVTAKSNGTRARTLVSHLANKQWSTKVRMTPSPSKVWMVASKRSQAPVCCLTPKRMTGGSWNKRITKTPIKLGENIRK
jgi:hypothetical protein